MNYTDEKLNVRCFYLKLLQKIPVSLAFSLAGALVFLFVYGTLQRGGSILV